MRVLVCGGRNFADKALLSRTLDSLYQKEGISTLIEGEARGADKLSAQWAEAYDIKILRFPANWKLYGRSAGYVRNRQMLTEGKPDLVIAFPGGRGTEMMCDIAQRIGVEVRKIVS